MRTVYTLARRDLLSTLRGPTGYLLVAAALLVDGLMFNAWALSEHVVSSQVLERFFFCTSGTTLLASLFIAMRLIAEERQSGTLILLSTAPLRDWQLVLGKYLSGLTVLAILTLSSVYMPLLILLHGKVSFGHVAAGYLGLMLLGSAALSLGLLASALAPNQLIAVALGAVFTLGFLLLWLLSRVASPPLQDLLAYLSLHDKHFRPFMRGLVGLADVVFYLSLTGLALLCATRVLEARRWR
jgi:ABC-2 type transport system permease protein